MHLHVLIQLLLEVPDLRCALLLDAGPSRSWALPCSWCSSCPRVLLGLVLISCFLGLRLLRRAEGSRADCVIEQRELALRPLALRRVAFALPSLAATRYHEIRRPERTKMQQGQHFGRVYYLRLSENRRPSPPLPPKTHPATRGNHLPPFFLTRGPGGTHGASYPLAPLK